MNLFVFLFLAISSSFASQSYVTFDAKPTDNWEEVFSKAGIEKYYKVQRGDNLYDISKILFGDPNFWPKIWSINSGYTNPHIIQTGDIIYFVGGTDAAAFQLQSISKRKGQASSFVYGTALLQPQLPPENTSKGPIAIPSTFSREYKLVDIDNEIKQVSQIQTVKRQAFFDRRKIPLIYELRDIGMDSVGKVHRVAPGRYAKTDSVVILQLNQESASGSVLSLYEKSKFRIKGRRDLNVRIKWMGLAKIVKRIEGEYYLARIIKSYDLISTNTFVSLEGIKRVEVPNLGESFTSSDIPKPAKIVGTWEARKPEVIGEESIIYLDKGQQGGLAAGSIYPIYTNFGRDILNKKDTDNFPFLKGYVKIVSLGENHSTGVVFGIKDAVSINDQIGKASE